MTEALNFCGRFIAGVDLAFCDAYHCLLDTTLTRRAQNVSAAMSPLQHLPPRENLVALKHKIHQKCMKLKWGNEYLVTVPAWEPETLSGFFHPALTQRGFFCC